MKSIHHAEIHKAYRFGYSFAGIGGPRDISKDDLYIDALDSSVPGLTFELVDKAWNDGYDAAKAGKIIQDNPTFIGGPSIT